MRLTGDSPRLRPRGGAPVANTREDCRGALHRRTTRSVRAGAASGRVDGVGWSIGWLLIAALIARHRRARHPARAVRDREAGPGLRHPRRGRRSTASRCRSSRSRARRPTRPRARSTCSPCRSRATRRAPPTWLEIAAAWFDPTRGGAPGRAGLPGRVHRRGRRTSRAPHRHGELAAGGDRGRARASSAIDFDSERDRRRRARGRPGRRRARAGRRDRVASTAQPYADVTGLRAAHRGERHRAARRRSSSCATAQEQHARGHAAAQRGRRPGADRRHRRRRATYDFPFDVTIQLENVGGPSAGMMFALGIIDKLTPGELTGGEHDRRHRHDHGRRRGRPDRRHPAEDVRAHGRRSATGSSPRRRTATRSSGTSRAGLDRLRGRHARRRARRRWRRSPSGSTPRPSPTCPAG